MSARSFALDAAAAVGRHAASVAAGVLTVALVARRLGPEGLGAWTLLGTTAFLVGLCDLGLSSGVGRALAAGDERGAQRAAERALLAVAAVGPPVALGAVASVLVGLRGLPAGSPWAVALLVAAGALGGACAMPLRSLAVGLGGVRGVASARAAGAAAQAALLPLAFAAGLRLEAPALAFAAGALAEAALLARQARRLSPGLALLPSPRRSLPGLGAALRDGAATLLLNAAVAAAVRLDVALLAAVAPLPAVAAYGVASRAVDQTFGLFKQLGVALQPRLIRQRDRSAALSAAAGLLPPLSLSALGALAIAGRPLLRAWAGPAADDPALPIALALLGAAAAVAALSDVACSLLTLAAPSPWASAYAVLLGSAVNLSVSVLGASRWGAWAIAGGTLAGNLVSLARSWPLAVRIVGWSRRQALRSLAPTAGALAALPLVGPPAAALSRGGLLSSFVACTLVALASLAAAIVAALASGLARPGPSAPTAPPLGTHPCASE